MFNVIRPHEAPESLQHQRKYDGEDVYTILEDIFLKNVIYVKPKSRKI